MTTTRKDQIENLLRGRFQPTHLEVIDESEHHRDHAHFGVETHLKAIIVAPEFAGLSRVKRQQLVYEVLRPVFHDGLHALSLTTMTPDEWQS